MSEWRVVANGQVMTSDGRALGTVGGLTANCFEVVAVVSGDGPFWLHADCILRVDDETVRVVFPLVRLGDYRLAAPTDD